MNQRLERSTPCPSPAFSLAAGRLSWLFLVMLSGCWSPAAPALVDPQPTQYIPLASRLDLSSHQVEHLRSLIAMPTDRPARVSEVIHVLRLHGANVSHQGRPLLDALLDEAFGTEVFGTPPILATQDGLSYTFTVTDDTVSEYHQDQVLAMFAQMGLPVDTPIQLRAGADQHRYTIADVVSESLARFHLKQRELEWSVIGLAAYLGEARTFENGLGETWTFDQLVDELIDRKLETAGCGGTHRLEALTAIYQADHRRHLLGCRSRLQLETFLQEKFSALLDAQTSDGSWDLLWWDPTRSHTLSMSQWDQSMLATGHLCEFLQTVPESLVKGKEVDSTIARAVDWLRPKLMSMQTVDSLGSVCPITHAAHAVILASTLNEPT